MNIDIIQEDGFEYVEKGEGPVVILLHGLMGGLDNFEDLIIELPKYGYKVVGPLLPLFEKPLLKTSIKHFTNTLRGRKKSYFLLFFLHHHYYFGVAEY